MKNKNKILVLSLLALGLFGSCVESFLETNSPSTQPYDDVFAKSSMTDAAILGIYASFMETQSYGQKITTNWSVNSDIETSSGFQSKESDMRTSGDNAPANFYAQNAFNAMDWAALYRSADLATAAVQGIRNSPLMQTAEKNKMQIFLGEALTLRALAYFEIVKHFGDAPFRHEASQSDLSNVLIGKTDRDTIYKYIVNDLLEAQKYAPWLKESSNKNAQQQPERISKGFVKGLCARVALFAGGWAIRDRNQFPNTTCEVHPSIPEELGYFTGRTTDWRRYYEIARNQCAEIIADPNNPHQLDPNYENIWSTVNNARSNDYNENLFEVAFGIGQSGDIGGTMGMVVDAGHPWSQKRAYGGSYVSTHAGYFYSFHKGDARRDVTCINIKLDNTDKEIIQNDPLGAWKMGKWRIYWVSDALRTLLAKADSRVSTGINWIVMRYSDIYLMFAEAQYGLENSESTVNASCGLSAAKALEKVRERAFGSGSPEIANYDPDFLEAIINERAWEFGGEALRKYDLIRWGRLYERIEHMKTAFVKLMQGGQSFQLFDKQFTGTEIPADLYYNYKAGGKRIDRASITYYSDETPQPSAETLAWGSGFLTDKNAPERVARVAAFASGINKDYNYLPVISSVTVVDQNTIISEIQDRFPNGFGNRKCNNRHPFPIYDNNISNGRGKLQNSYGF